MSFSEIAFMSIAETTKCLGNGSLSCVDVMKASLAHIDSWNPKVNAFISVYRDEAMASARAADLSVRRGHRLGPLHGIPVSLKDLIDCKLKPTTAASNIFERRVPLSDAEIVRRLAAAGAIVIGKANMSELAIGGMQSKYGWILNPWDTTRSSGGSSGGSAASVITGMNHISIGTDTGGSIRVPSSFCGAVGFKPTFGWISTQGVIPLAKSLDHLGPIARTVADAAAVFEALRGAPGDHAGGARRSGRVSGTAVKSIGVPDDRYLDGMGPDVAAIMDRSLDVLRRLGYRLKKVSLADARLVQQVHLVIMQTEGAANHLDALRRRPKKFSNFARDFFRIGALYPATAYIRAWQIRQRILQSYMELFASVDAIVMPSTLITALKPGQSALRKDGIPVLAVTTTPSSLCGLPALSVPAGMSREGLPVGMQLIGRPHGDDAVLGVGMRFEQAVSRQHVSRWDKGMQISASAGTQATRSKKNSRSTH